MNVSSLGRFRWLRLRGVLNPRALLAVSALSALAVSTQSLAQPNLLVAGNFEGISNPLDGFGRQTAAGVWGSESGSVSGAANGITPFGSQMLQINHAGGGSSAQTNQIVAGPFKAGSVVTFSVKFNTWRVPDGLSSMQVGVSFQSAVLDADPNTDNRSGVSISSPLVTLDANTSTWQTVTVTSTLASDTPYLSAELFIKMNSNGAALGTPLAYADDAVLTVVPPTPAIHWVNWMTFETVNGVTKYVGQMVVPRTGGGSTTVTVKYTPPGGIAFFQASTGTDYFSQGQGGALGRNPARSPYVSAKVPNIPDGGGAVGDKTDIVALQSAGTNRLEFTDASTGQPISIASPVFAYVSLNGNGYGFDQDFDILSFGDGTVRDQGFFGPGTSFKSVATVNGATQYQLLGTGEPHGTLQFRGSFSTVTWQSLSNEYWNGFTIGVAQLADDVPIANAGPDQTLDATSASGATVQLAGSASGSTKTPFSYSWSGDFGTATGANPSVTLGVGTHTITLVVTDAAGASDSDDVVVTVRPNPAPVITSATNAAGVYGSPFTYTITATNSPTGFGATDLPPGLTISGAVISGTPTQAGLFSVKLSAQNSGGTGNGSVLLNIAKANATVVVTPYSTTYDGNSHSATVTSITGVNGETGGSVGTVTLNSTHTDAGTYSDSWSFTGTANYNSIGAQTITDTIAKADASVVVNGYTGTYDGAPHGATGFATGISRDVDLSVGLRLGASFTDAPGGTANWTFAGGANYNDASGSVAIVINKADARVVVNGYAGTYDGAAHGATGSATGVGGVDLTSGLNFGATFTNTPGGTANWSFAGGTNYNDAHGSVAIDIAKANATVVVTPYSVTYDGQAHSAAVASITGVNGETGATVGAVTLNTTHTNAGTYADSWSLAGTSNYNNIASTPITNTIAKATATAVVTPYSVTYDGQAHSATIASITGVNGETGATVGAVTLNTTHTNAGTYADSWSLAGTANYNNIASTPITNTIARASATVVVSPYSVTYDGHAHSATVASIVGVNGETGATVGAVTLNTTHTNAGTYADAWSFTGAANYNNIASTAITNAIAKANATVVVTPYNAEFTAQPISATVASITGVNGEAGATVGVVTLNTTHTAVGTYADTWSFTGTANYNNIGATPITDVIKDTTPPVFTSLSTNAPTLWPPNHKMVAVKVSATATDLGGIASLKIVSVTSNEPDNGLGDGDTAGDIQVTGDLTLNLRAERGGAGSGRIYTIVVEARDGNGVTSTKSVAVSVPLNQGK